MILTSVALTFVTLAAASQTQLPATAPGNAVIVHSVLRQDGKQQIWEIDRNRLAALPPWTPNAGAIPLIAARAVTLAQSWASRHNPESKGWTELNTALRRIGAEGRGAPASPNGWFYTVLLEPNNRESVSPSAAFSDAGRFWVVVLFDGSVVEPKIVDAPETDTLQAGTGTGVIPPRLLTRTNPNYTADAMRARIEGTVTLRCVVDTNGVCEDIQVAESLDAIHGLDEEAIKAARQWRFAPGTRGGQPVKVGIMIQMSFNLKDRR